MDANKLKVGQKRRYKSKANEGKGEITEINVKKTGMWVTLADKVRKTYVTVRPSQVSPL